MRTVFYDLETTDTLTIGQIVNFAFIEVDEHFEIRSECCGTVSIGRLQLPSPEAVLVTHLDVAKHQQSAQYTEREAMVVIYKYLASLCEDEMQAGRARAPGEKAVQLIGYNSSKFDLTFLRTSLIRNGINPYFNGKILPGDLFHAVRYAFMQQEHFPTPVKEDQGEQILSLSLEKVTRALGLLTGPQLHESRFDVLLTIALAKRLKEDFGCDVRSFASYLVSERRAVGDIFVALSPNYECVSGKGDTARVARIPYLLLDEDYRSALWLNLKRFAELVEKGEKGSEALYCYTKANAFFIAEKGDAAESVPYRDLVPEAQKRFKGVTVKNYFPKSVCDIECDIYRLDFSAIEALRVAIHERDAALIQKQKNSDLLALYDRHRIGYYQWGGGKDDRVRELLREYAKNRYGGAMRIDKARYGVESQPVYHPAFATLMEKLASPECNKDEESQHLMANLRDFYQTSDVVTRSA